MKRIKDNSYDIVVLIINQIGISIFALVLYTSMGFIGENNKELEASLRVVFSVFSTLFYWALIYTKTWEFGANDQIKIESGKANDLKQRGWILPIVANFPNLLLAIFAVVSNILHEICNIDIFSSLFFIFNLFMRFFAAMYIGIIGVTGVSYLVQCLFFIVMSALTILVCRFGYEMGRKNIKIFSPSKK